MSIIVVDLETTGLAPPEGEVCEIGFVKLYADSDISVGRTMLVKPTRPIPPEASAIHHITDEDVARTGVSWEKAAQWLMGEAPIYLAAHNARFDRQWLTPAITGDVRWVDTYKAALRLWPEAPSHSNQALRYWKRPQGWNDLQAMPAHSAAPDAYITACLLREMLKSASLDDLVEWSKVPALLPRCTIGDWRGKPWPEVDIGFLRWVMNKRRDDEDLIFSVQAELDRREREHHGAAA